MRRDTLIDYFRDLVELRNEYLIYDDGYRQHRYTYKDVALAAQGFATRLTKFDVRKGDRVVFWGENRPEWIVCYWGCLLAGVVVVPIDYRSSIDFVLQVKGIVNARLILMGNEVSPFPVDSNLGKTITWKFSDIDWHQRGQWPQIPIASDDIAQIIFTSGATAEPKGVVIRHRNIMANIVPVEREVKKYSAYAWPFNPIRFLNLLPLSHMFGQSMATSVPPMLKGTVIFTRSLNPQDLIELIKTERISVLVCVPKMLEVLREYILRKWPEASDPPPTNFGILRRWWRYRRVHSAFGNKFWAFVVGAAPLPAELETFWRKLSFAVIQGYGLTETAPIVTLNHPFKTSQGSVGTPIGGVEVRIAEDGEILVRGANVTSGYYNPSKTQQSSEPALDDEGWLHTGDIGERDTAGRLFIKGRKKEMIVTSAGLNVFPEDVEHVLNKLPGVKDSAVISVPHDTEEWVHAVLLLSPGSDLDQTIRQANLLLQDHQRIRGASTWAGEALPRTEGTGKLKRRKIRTSVLSGQRPDNVKHANTVDAVISQFSQGSSVQETTTLKELGLSSLERVELMVALEDRFQTRIDEARFAQSETIADLKQLVNQLPPKDSAPEPVEFPSWNRSLPFCGLRRLSLSTWILPLTKLFAHIQVDGLEHLRQIKGPVVFASNHQSHMDVPVILAALPGNWRAQIATAMAKEFFKAHFFPSEHTWRERMTNSLNYYLAACYFNAFPLPQREAGARQTLKYIGELLGEGWSVLLFPEGVRSENEEIKKFRGGIGMIASRLDVPVIPIRISGVNQVLHPKWKMARPGTVRVTFGRPLFLRGDNYAALATDVETTVRAL